jgi:hypothetical protein
MSPRVVELNDEESKPVPSPSPIKHLPPDQLAHSQLNSISNNHEMISSSTIVPSINALMNGPSTSSLPNMVDGAKPGEHQKNGIDSGRSASIQRNATDGPKDIPSEKIGFGEDMRALRQLDRVFSA